MKHFCLVGLVAAALVATAGTATADTYWIKAGASGKGKSQEDPAGVLQPLLAKAERGDVFRVAQGEYNGRDLKGEFALEVPDLTLVGGYNDDFSERNPFKYPTVLRRKEGVKTNYTEVLDGIIGIDPNAHADGRKVGCSGLILDGFFFDSGTRNVYIGPGPRLAQGGSWKEPIIKLVTSDNTMTANITIRNCVFLNCYYQGIYVKWWGDRNEVSNCLFVNCSIAGIDATGAMGAKDGLPEASLLVKNNTLAGFYSHDKAAMALGVKPGSKGQYQVVDNVFAFLSAPSNNGVGPYNEDSMAITGNVFFFTGDAEKIMRDQGNAAALDDDDDDDEEEEAEEEEEEEDDGGSGGATGVSGNVNQDPGFQMDNDWFDALTSFGIVFNKFKADAMNAYRATLGMEERKSGGGFGGRPDFKAFMRPYPRDDWAAIPTHFTSKIEGKGFQVEGPFADYEERPCELPGAVPGGKDEYEKISWDDLVGRSKYKQLDGKKVKFKIGFNPRKETYTLSKDGIGPHDYIAFEGRKPGNKNQNMSEKVMCYVVIGTKAANRFNEYGQKSKRQKSWADGAWIRGVIHATGSGKTPYTVVVDYVGKVK